MAYEGGTGGRGTVSAERAGMDVSVIDGSFPWDPALEAVGVPLQSATMCASTTTGTSVSRAAPAAVMCSRSQAAHRSASSASTSTDDLVMDREHRHRRRDGCPVRPQPGQRPLEDVGARPLDRRVQFFGELADPMPRPSRQGVGRDLAVCAERDARLADRDRSGRTAAETATASCLAQRHAVVVLGVRPQPLGTHPVEQPEVQRLGELAVVLGRLTTQDRAGRLRMQILAGAKRLLHRRIARDLGGDAQLDLRVVGFDEDASRGGANAAPIGGVPRDVLQIRRAAAHATAGRADQAVAGVDASGGRVDMLEIPVAVGRDPLLRPALRRSTRSTAGCWSADGAQRRLLRVRDGRCRGWRGRCISCAGESTLTPGRTAASSASRVASVAAASSRSAVQAATSIGTPAASIQTMAGRAANSSAATEAGPSSARAASRASRSGSRIAASRAA